MSKIAHYLQEHLLGEVMTSADARRYFATDNSIFALPPALVVYPRNENDVRKTARFSWQLAERGRVIPITARGAGTDLTGAALGSGIMLVFPAHMNRILEMDTKSGSVSVEPGINYGKLQQTLQTHGRYLPPYPASLEYSTVGGAVGNNSSGDKSFKYGDTRTYVKYLRVVLANGEVIETGRINKRDLSKKLGLSTFEGEIYRGLDTLLEEQISLVERTQLPVTKNNAGYNLIDIKHRDGSFDLTPLFVGSQGTLGIITEVILDTDVYNPETSLMMAMFENVEATQNAILELRKLSDLPSSIEMVDGNLLSQAQAINPNQLKGLVTPPFSSVILFVECDDANERHRKRLTKKVSKILEKYGTNLHLENDLEKQQQIWKIRQASASILGQTEGLQRAVPVIEDAAVPPEQIKTYLEAVYALCNKVGIKPAIWGHAGDANFHIQPLLNLGQIGDRQKAFKLMEEYAKLVISLGGTISAEHNDGRLRSPYLESQYGTEVYNLFQKVKLVFDPYGTLNPGVKLGSTIDDIKALIRPDYTMDHIYDHLPRS